ncbi:MAG: isoprenylcysteine carboxylmethyltransferase family protein [Syntrophobacteraceae bacterium]
MARKDLIPLIMWFCLTLGICVLALIRPSRLVGIWNDYPINLDAAFIGFYIMWMLIELRISRRDADTGGKTTSDSATCQIYGVGQALTIFTALWFPSVWGAPNAAHLFGITLFVLGACYRSWAIRSLGQFYSHRVRTVVQHRIVDSGPYRFTRHPAYAGMIIANAGICLYFLNWVTTCVFLLILVPAILLRIMVEERTLFEIQGYSEFAGKRKRLFPAVW